MSERHDDLVDLRVALAVTHRMASDLERRLAALLASPVLTNDGLTAAEEAGLATHEEAEAVREQRQREADSLDGGMRQH